MKTTILATLSAVALLLESNIATAFPVAPKPTETTAPSGSPTTCIDNKGSKYPCPKQN